MLLRATRRLARRHEDGTFRRLGHRASGIDFASNDYLGLARSTIFAEQVALEWERQQKRNNILGATGSRLLTGDSCYARHLEDEIATFHGHESALLFSCGYMANLGLMTAVAGAEDTVLFDAHVHASMRDGIRLSRARALPFRHNDVDHLHERLKRKPARGHCFICIESLYSTDGSQAPLPAICHLADQYGAFLLVDEAHAVGVYGKLGQGLVAEHQLTHHLYAHVVTFGKALGCHGAAVMGNAKLRELLVNYARTFIYTTAMPLTNLAAIRCSYSLLPKLDNARAQLNKLAMICREHNICDSQSHIQAVPMTGSWNAKRKAKELQENGFDVRALVSPTVQRGQEVLRLNLHAYNSSQELLRCLQLL